MDVTPDQSLSNGNANDKKMVMDINKLRDQNLNYIDSSDVIVEYYKNQKVSGLERYFLQIEEWLQQTKTDNKPLVISGDEGFGKKTLLVKWMEYHNLNKVGRSPDLIIIHFATTGGNNSNYFFALYRILIKLREALNISQKVELLEEKLRRYFSYWLDLSNKELEQQIIKDAQIIYDRVILIFEGIDHFHEQNDINNESNLAFWLPRIFPSRIKVIVTCEAKSQSMQHFKALNCQILNLTTDQSVIKNIIDTHMTRETYISDKRRMEIQQYFTTIKEQVRKQSLFVRTYLCLFIPYPTPGIVDSTDVNQTEIEKVLQNIDPEQIKKFESIEDLINYGLDYFINNLFDQSKLKMLLMLFTITQKGLTIDEIKDVCDITQQEWLMFLVFFKLFLMHYKDLWIINNDIFKMVVSKRFQKSQKEIQELHEKTAEAIERKTTNSIRKLEEQTFHLFRSKSYFQLKEVISIIENFLLLFNPNNKYDLCRYWQMLEEHGFDPVLEYNKAVEGFQIHYHPTAEDIFRIIIQISRFLKEFGDFETVNTPDFRHPAIMGQEKELQDIGLFREILVLDMYYNQDSQLKTFKILEGNNLDPQQKLQQKLEALKYKQNRLKAGRMKKNSQIDDDYLTQQSEVEKRRKVVKAKVLNEMEALNVEIPQNRDLIRQHYLQKMKVIRDENNHLKDNNTEVDETKIDFNIFDSNQIKEKIRQITEQSVQQIQKTLSLQGEEISEHVSSDYYYKRWIWIQFPWACMSLKCDYSAIIKQCFSSATNYMKVEEELAYTNQALKIAIEAKLKKQQMYERNPNEENSQISIIAKNKRTYNSSQDTSSHQSSVPMLPVITNTSQNNNSVLSLISSSKQSKILNKKGGDKIDKAFFITQDYLNMNLLNKELLDKQVKNEDKSVISTKDGETTMKMIEKSLQHKNRIQGYKANSVTLNSYDVTEVFPQIKIQMNQHTGKELQVLEHQAKVMRRELDQLTYENQQLAKDLKFQKVLEFNSGYIKKELENFENLKDNLKKLESNVLRTEEEYRYSTLQKERIKTILKICKDNKQQNEDWSRHLNYLINNLRKLIKFEEADIIRNKEQIIQLKRIIDEFLTTFTQKIGHQKNLIKEIKTSIDKKKRLDQMFQDSDVVIQDSAIKTIQKVKSNQRGQDLQDKQQKKQQQYEKTSKVVTEKLKAYQQDYQKLLTCFDVKDPEYINTPEFQKFLQNLDKKTELEASLMTQRQKFQELEKIKQQKEQLLKTYQQANQLETKTEENEEEPSSEEDEKEFKLTDDQKQTQESELDVKQRQLENFLKIKLNCQMALSTLYQKLTFEQKIHSPNVTADSFNYDIAKISELLKQKKDHIIENMGEQSYRSICDGSFDINQVYKSILVYHPDPLLTNKEIE